jgi:hypothetical protein
MEVLNKGVANSVKALLYQDDFEDPFGKSAMDEPEIGELLEEIKNIHYI